MKASVFRRIAGVLFISLALSTAYIAGWLTRPVLPPFAASHASPAGMMDEAWRLVDEHFFGTLPPTRTRTYAAIRGLLGSLNDPYSVLIEPPATRLENDQLRGQFGGIGADLWLDAQQRVHLSPYPDGPAAKAGVLAGDLLLAIEGTQVAPGQPLDELEARLRGDIGTRVTLTLERGGQTVEIGIVRAQIAPPSVMWHMIDGAPGIGYISIRMFTDRTLSELKRGIDEVRSAGASALILDLRDNGGGLLQSAVDVAGQFVGGVVMIEQQRDGGEREFLAPAEGAARDLPVIVLVNRSTASASEIVAGALKDRNRAVLMGERTYGKGSVQSLYPLPDGSSLHITTAIWLTPGRRSLAGQSLQPDIEVARTTEDRTAGRDPVLDRAVAYLLNGS